LDKKWERNTKGEGENPGWEVSMGFGRSIEPRKRNMKGRKKRRDHLKTMLGEINAVKKKFIAREENSKKMGGIKKGRGLSLELWGGNTPQKEVKGLTGMGENGKGNKVKKRRKVGWLGSLIRGEGKKVCQGRGSITKGKSRKKPNTRVRKANSEFLGKAREIQKSGKPKSPKRKQRKKRSLGLIGAIKEKDIKKGKNLNGAGTIEGKKSLNRASMEAKPIQHPKEICQKGGK